MLDTFQFVLMNPEYIESSYNPNFPNFQIWDLRVQHLKHINIWNIRIKFVFGGKQQIFIEMILKRISTRSIALL